METPVFVPRQIQLDATNRIDEDLNCLKCGYNLRGLLLDGLCPECGTPVGRSVQGDLLRFCSPDWVETLASGMNWIVASIALALLLGCGTGLVTSVMGQGAMLMTLVGVATAVVSFIGYWKVTTPDPSRLDQETSMTARKLVRITIVLSLLLNTPQQVILASLPAIGLLLTVVGGVASIVETFASFIYARQLALRIPDLSLAKQTRIVMWGLAVVGVVGIGAAVLGGAAISTMVPAPASAPAGPAGPAAAPMAGLMIGGCIAGAGGLIFGIWSLLLLLRYRRSLLEAARQARGSWAQDIAPPIAPPATT